MPHFSFRCAITSVFSCFQHPRQETLHLATVQTKSCGQSASRRVADGLMHKPPHCPEHWACFFTEAPLLSLAPHQ